MQIYIHTKLSAQEQGYFRKSLLGHNLLFGQSAAASLPPGIDIIVGNAPVDWVQPIAGRLKLIQTESVGVDCYLPLDWKTLHYSGVQLGNMAGFYSLPVAEDALAAILLLLRAFPDILQHQQQSCWDFQAIRSHKRNLSGKTVVVLGYGGIGRELERLLVPFGCHLIPLRSRDLRGNKDALLLATQQSSILVSTVPYCRSTHHLVSREILQALGSEGIFANVGRGGTVDEEALVWLLCSGGLGAAYLDVTEEEPLAATSPLWQAPNLILGQHGAGGFEGELEARNAYLLQALRHFLATGTAYAPVDMLKEVG